jgi:hypothetical protein
MALFMPRGQGFLFRTGLFLLFPFLLCLDHFGFNRFGGFVEATQINSPSFETTKIPLPSNPGAFIPNRD